MSALAALPTEPLRVHVAASGAMRESVVSKLRRAGIALTAGVDRPPGIVLVAAAQTVDEALDGCHPGRRSAAHRLLLVADAFPPSGVRRAVRAGVRAMLRARGMQPAELRAAVRATDCGDGWLPHEVLMQLLSGAEEPSAPLVTPLTLRQTEVLTLMAEGYSNAAIARSLRCSQHTVKNVVYELTGRLQARNRAQAVATALRAGMI